MKRMIFWTLVAAAGAASGAALADDDTGAFYVAPMLQYGVLDDHRAAKDDFAGDLAVGYNFAPHFSGEFNYSEGSFRIHDQQSQKLYAYTLDGMFKLLPSSIIDPYALLGGGELDDTVGRGNGTAHTWTAEGGLGALTGIGAQTGSFRVQLRTEVKYRREFVEASLYNPKNPGDVLYGVGVQFEFGAPVPPPAPKMVAVAPPPPPPPPAPEPPPPPPPPPPPHQSPWVPMRCLRSAVRRSGPKVRLTSTSWRTTCTRPTTPTSSSPVIRIESAPTPTTCACRSSARMP